MGVTLSFSRQHRRMLLVSLAIAILLSGGQLGAADSDEVVVVVSAKSQVTEIPPLHLADLYLGRTTRFPNGEAAEPIDLAPGSAAREAFYEGYLGRSQAEIKAHWSKIIFTGRGRPPLDVDSGAEMKRLIADDRQKIGYLERRLVDSTVRIVPIR